MIDKKNSIKTKKNKVLNFLKESNNKGFSLNEISKSLFEELGYINLMTTRISISFMLNELLKDNYVYFEEQKGGIGSIPKKIWYLTNLQNHEIKIDNKPRGSQNV